MPPLAVQPGSDLLRSGQPGATPMKLQELLRAFPLLLLLACNAYAEPQYALVPIAPPAASLSFANAISADGTVVGCYRDSKQPDPALAFTWKAGTLRVLGPGCAEAINSAGTVVGVSPLSPFNVGG